MNQRKWWAALILALGACLLVAFVLWLLRVPPPATLADTAISERSVRVTPAARAPGLEPVPAEDVAAPELEVAVEPPVAAPVSEPDAELREIQVTVRVVDGEGNPVVGAAVEVARGWSSHGARKTSEDDPVEARGETDANGGVLFTLEIGLLGFSATTESAAARREYELLTDDAEVTLTVFPVLTFVVSYRYGDTGELATGIPVRLEHRVRAKSGPSTLSTLATASRTTSLAGEASIEVTSVGWVHSTVWMDGYQVSGKDFDAELAFGEVVLEKARAAELRLTRMGEKAFVFLNVPTDRNRSTFGGGDRTQEGIWNYPTASTKPARFVVDPGAPYAIDMVEVPAGGDWQGEYEPRDDGGTVRIVFPRQVGGEIEIFRDGTQINGGHSHMYGVRTAEIAIERLAPDIDYDFVLRGPYIPPAGPGEKPYQAMLALGTARVVPHGEAVLVVPEERLVEER